MAGIWYTTLFYCSMHKTFGATNILFSHSNEGRGCWVAGGLC